MKIYWNEMKWNEFIEINIVWLLVSDFIYNIFYVICFNIVIL